MAAEHDPGFDRSIFAGQLALVRGLGPLALSEYGVDSDSLTELQSRLVSCVISSLTVWDDGACHHQLWRSPMRIG